MKGFLLLFFGGIFGTLAAQAPLSGKVTTSEGEPLAFATIYLRGTTIGTTTNVQGQYALTLQPGNWEVVFQYVGFEPKVMPVVMGKSAQNLDVTLRPEAIKLSEFVVNANAEDPAYPIMRKAIAKRTYYRDQVAAYSCNTYVKGNIKFLNAPKKIMGQDLGDLGGILDTNRQGIVYLSESQSRLYFSRPNRYKEEMLYTKVAGNDQGFGFNRADRMTFNLYESYAELGRNIVSPLNDNAFAYYSFRLVGTLAAEGGQKIYKIEVLPKRSEDPAFRGFLYIVDEWWNLQRNDLLLTSGAIKQPGLDSLRLVQEYVPIAGTTDIWRLVTTNISFRAGALGFRLGGSFTCVYSQYDLAPALGAKFFDQEVFLVHAGANEQNQTFWDSLRPIPLTLEETRDYQKKDSLQVRWKSRPYLDSIDAKNNKFTPIKLLTGFSINRSYQKQYFSVESPLNTIQFNTVQGWNLALNGSFRQDYDDYSMRWWSVAGRVNYGFADQNLRFGTSFTYHFDQVHFSEWRIAAGRETQQFNPAEPITPMLNSLYTLLERKNYLKLFEKTYVKTAYQREITNGIFFTGDLEYAERTPLQNNSDYSFGDEARRVFTSNNPQNPADYAPAFGRNQALLLNLALRLRIRQEYISYPGRKYIEDVKGPDFYFQYTKGITALGSDVNFDLLRLRVQDDNLPFKALGYSEVRAEWGWFLNNRQLFFTDYAHFLGNRTLFGNANTYLRSFLRLPYYDHSTNDWYLQLHWQHHFEGAILDRIPIINKLGWKLVSGLHYLRTANLRDYWELTLGLDEVGYKIFRPLRIDLVASFGEQRQLRLAPVLSFNL